MKQAVRDGLFYGLFIAATAYTAVRIMGYNPQSLMVLLYLYVLSGILLNVKSELAKPLTPLLKRIVIVAEGEEMKSKKLLTGEEYKVKGDVEKL